MERITVKELIKKDNISGCTICFPTDTVFGIGALATDLKAINKIYAMKRRDKDKPLAILCAKISDVEEHVERVNESAYKLMNEYWPGALTIIFIKKASINDSITAGKPTVAFRIPNSPIALAIINRFGIMATTSVNISGEKELNTKEEIENIFSDYIDYMIIDDEPLESIPSTIIDATSTEIKILRKGKIEV